MSLPKAAKDRFKRAGNFYKEGKIDKALPILQQLVADHPESAILSASLGNTYWDVGLLDEAEEYFQRAIEKSPSSLKFSLIYFHLLWFREKWDAAIAEIERIQIHSRLEGDYLEIAEEINQKTEFKIKIRKA